jgi:muramoyltetrapeptide carboxypeptidase
MELPSAYGLSFGHVPDNCTLPIGALASFDAQTLEITIEEAVVV